MRRNCASGTASVSRCAHFQVPYTAPAIETRKSSAISSGETRGFGFISGRAIVCVRVAGIAPVGGVRAAVAVAPVIAGLRVVGVVLGLDPVTAGRAVPDRVADVDIVASVSRLNARSRADWN